MRSSLVVFFAVWRIDWSIISDLSSTVCDWKLATLGGSVCDRKLVMLGKFFESAANVPSWQPLLVILCESSIFVGARDQVTVAC